MKTTWRIATTLALVLTALGAVPAHALVAGNSWILNRATLNFNDGAADRQVEAEVKVTVDTVLCTPTLSSPDDQSSGYGGVDTLHAYAYTLTACGNGPGTFTLAVAVTDSTNTTGRSAALSDTSFGLGSSVTVGGSTTTAIKVPSDGSADSTVNGIQAEDWVVIDIGGADYAIQVQSVSDPGDDGIATITLKTDGVTLPSPPGAGVPVNERGSFTLDVESGTLQAAGTDITVDVRTTASFSGNPDPADTDDVQSTYTSGVASLTKYVRNTGYAAGTGGNAGGTGGEPFTINGSTATYYTGGVTGYSGDVLEYLLVAENSGGGELGNSYVDDVLPTGFVTFRNDAFGGSTQNVIYVDAGAGETELDATENPNGDRADLSGGTLRVNLGTGATSAAGGTIGSGSTVMVLYQVTIQ